jgi:hypothetical protein
MNHKASEAPYNNGDFRPTARNASRRVNPHKASSQVEVTAFLAREGPGKPRVRAYGNGVVLDWKVQVYGAELEYERENGSRGIVPGGWTYLRVVGRTLTSAVGVALRHERKDTLGLSDFREEQERAGACGDLDDAPPWD